MGRAQEGNRYDREDRRHQRSPIRDWQPRPRNRSAKCFKDRPDTIFDPVNADAPTHFVPGFQRTGFGEVILSSSWPG
jgi:hypothetical protein